MAKNQAVPTNELNIRYTKNGTAYFYGLDINLSQNDLPYIIPPKGQRRLASQMNFVVYGDTVTLDGYLANPGKNIEIYARKIIFLDSAYIDTAGPDPDQATDYTAGNPVKQAEEFGGADGTAGADGGEGIKAGNVTLMAEIFEGKTPDQPGVVRLNRSFDNDSLDHCLAMLRQAQIQGPLSITVAQNTNLNVSEFKNDGFQNALINNTAMDRNNCIFTMNMLINNLSFSGNASLSIDWFGKTKNFAFPIQWKLTKIEIAAQWSLDFKNNTATPGKIELGFGKWDYNLGNYSGRDLDTIKGFLMLFRIKTIQGLQSVIQTQLCALTNTFPMSGLAGTTPDLYISCKGGRGGRGRDGHDGCKGAVGAPGKDSNTVVSSFGISQIPAESIGGKGGAGGRGGNAGHSGKGGPGSTLNIGFIKSGSVMINYDIDGGDGGPPAAPGAGGQGGEGGAPGTYLEGKIINPHSNYTERVPSIQGEHGVQGPGATFGGAQGAAGAAGTLTVNGGRDTTKPLLYNELAPVMKVEQLLITQRAAGQSYLNASKPEDYQYVITLANWLVNITQPLIQPGFKDPNWNPNDIAIAKSIHDQATAMIANFRQGLDFYGNYPNWAPVLTLVYYQQRLDQLLALGKDIEEQYNIYLDQKSTADQKTAALDKVKQQLFAKIADDQAEINDLNDQINTLDTVIANQLVQLQQQQNIINADKQTFSDDLRTQTNKDTGCTFTDVLKTITNIVEFGAGIADGVGAIAEAYKAYKAIDTTAKKLKNVITVIKKVDTAVTDLQKTVTAVQNGLKDTQVDPPDVGLVVTDKAKFDDFIKQYLDKVSSAQTLKDAVDGYFNLINARNQNILSYNALFGKRDALQAAIDQKSSQIEKIKALRGQQIDDPALPEYISFMRNAYDNLKAIIIKKLYEENQAYWYWSLEKNQFAASDLDIANMAVMHTNISNNIDKTKNNMNQAPQSFERPITITATDYPISFGALPQAKKLVFTLPVKEPYFYQGEYQIIAQTFKLEFPDIKDFKGVLLLSLIHGGTSYQLQKPVKGQSGQTVVQFVHPPREIPFNIDYTDPHNKAGGEIGSSSEGYTGLSPFTTWTLNFDRPENNLNDPSKHNYLDLSTIKSVIVTFIGTYQYAAPNVSQRATTGGSIWQRVWNGLFNRPKVLNAGQ